MNTAVAPAATPIWLHEPPSPIITARAASKTYRGGRTADSGSNTSGRTWVGYSAPDSGSTTNSSPHTSASAAAP
jgi:hypothetical protein